MNQNRQMVRTAEEDVDEAIQSDIHLGFPFNDQIQQKFQQSGSTLKVKRQEEDDIGKSRQLLLSLKQFKARAQFVKKQVGRQQKQIYCKLQCEFSYCCSLFHKYHLLLSQNNQHLLSARKKFRSRNPYYHIGLSTYDFDAKDVNYVARLKGNINGMYTLFDNSKYRRNQLLKINIINSTVYLGMKKITVYLPNKLEFQEDKGYQINLRTSCKITNKAPQYDYQKKKYCLNLKGKASIKAKQNTVFEMERLGTVLLMSKVEENEFRLQFGGPFTALQSFAVALANLDFCSR